MEVVDGFAFYPGSSTTNIFFYDHDEDRLDVLRWRPTGAGNPMLPMPPDVLDSCRGLVAYRRNGTSTYCVVNPFLGATLGNRAFGSRDLPVPPTIHHPRDTHVVLAAIPSPRSIIVFCIVSRGNNVFSFDTFTDSSGAWENFESRFHHPYDLKIVPDSGVSLGNMAFWFVTDSFKTFVLRFEFRGEGTTAPTFLNLPSWVHGRVHMRLGRALRHLCLVVVNESRRRVELFRMNEPPGTVWTTLAVFDVEVPHTAVAAQNGEDWVASWRPEDRTLVCREMPMPIRFDSFKVELLFWVHGRVVLLENSAIDPDNYLLTVFPGIWPIWISYGVPHVATSLLPTEPRRNHPLGVFCNGS